MATQLLTLPAAPAVRSDRTTRYTEYRTPAGWVRKTKRLKTVGLTSVRVIRREVMYRSPIGTRGERSHVSFTVIGTGAADYVRECIPTVRVVPAACSDDQVFGSWFY